MTSSKDFNQYIRKNLFSTFLSSLFIFVLFFLYSHFEENSLDLISQELKVHEKNFNKIQTQIVQTNKSFQELKEKVVLIENFHNKIDCSFVQNVGMNLFRLDIEEINFDNNRNLFLIYDPHVEFQMTNSFSFYHDVKFNKDWLTIDLGKEEKDDKKEQTLNISKICYVLIGYKLK